MSVTRGDSPTLDPDDAPPRRDRYRLRTTREQRVAIRVVAGLSALVAAVSGASPTAWRAADLVLLAVLGALVPLAASRARRWSLIVLAATGAAFARGALLLLAAASAGAVATLILTDRRHRLVAAIAGALGLQVVLRLPATDPEWLLPVVGSLAVGTVLYSGYRHTHRRQRRIIGAVVLGAAGLAVVASVLLLVAALSASRDLEQGVASARAGLSALKEGDTEAAAAELESSSAAFRTAQDALEAPYAQPARALPVISDYAQAASAAATAGAEITTAAQELSAIASYDDLAPRQGQVDLELVGQLSGPASETAAALERADRAIADVRRTWLVPPVAEPLDDLAAEVESTLPSARLAAAGLEVAPALLGADEDRTYLVVMGQPAESRFLGGFAGSYGELSAVDGKVDLVRNGPMNDLFAPPGAPDRDLSGPEEYLARYGRYQPTRNLQNVTASPDFPSVARVAAELYPQAGGKPVDGVIYVDPYGLAALLQVTGPVEVPGYDVTLNSDNAANLLTRDQYELFPGNRDREDFLSAALEATFDALTDRDLPAPRRIGEVLGPAATEGHLMFEAFEPAEADFLDLAGSRGEFPVADGTDFLAVRTANSGPNKLDVYLRRTIAYDATIDPGSGIVTSTATITLENNLPDYPLPDIVTGNRAQIEGRGDAPPPGTNIQYVSVYSALGLDEARLDGTPAPTEVQEEFGHHVYSFLVEVPPKASVTLELDLVGLFEELDAYELTVVPQPMALPDRLTVDLSTTEGWALTGEDGELESTRTWTVDAMLRPEDFEVDLVPRG